MSPSATKPTCKQREQALISERLLDSKSRTGAFKLILRYSSPLIPRDDLAGVVIGEGCAVRRFKPGVRTGQSKRQSGHQGRMTPTRQPRKHEYP